jgi:hypothetical protein
MRLRIVGFPVVFLTLAVLAAPLAAEVQQAGKWRSPPLGVTG